MKNLKARQRDQLIWEFAVLNQPFEELATVRPPPELTRYRLAIAKVQAGDPAWRATAKEYATFADDIIMQHEFNELSHINERFWCHVRTYIADSTRNSDLGALQRTFAADFHSLKERFYDLLGQVPFDWEPEIFDRNTPFTAYLSIRACISSAKTQMHYFDRYLKEDFFPLFLQHVNREVSVRLITTATGVRDVSYVSNLARREFSDYRLIEAAQSDFHDRNLRIDRNIFSLGPGVDRAGTALTNFGPADDSQQAHAALDDIMSRGQIVHQS